MSAPGTPKASQAAITAVQEALGRHHWLGPCRQSETSPNGFDTPICLTHSEYWTERGCPVAVAAADAAAPHNAADALRDAADWLEEAYRNSGDKGYTHQLREGFRLAAGWVRSHSARRPS